MTSRARLSLTALILLAELAILAWEHFHGGVRSHHILNRSDLPAISNWWGTLLIPVLAWFLIGRIQRRVNVHSGEMGAPSRAPASIVAGFAGALLFSALLSVSFTSGHENISSFMFQGMFVLAVLLPVYRAECLLGFVLGMTFTFGAILPTAIGPLVAAFSAAIHLVVWPLLVRLWAWFRA